MKIYLDNSVLNRPFDDQSYPKIKIEIIATILIFKLIEGDKLQLVNSSVIEYENSKNPFLDRKDWINSYLSQANYYQEINLTIKKEAERIQEYGVGAIDSLHLATAEFANVDYFLTCDMGIIKKYQGKVMVINPVDFINFLTNK